MDEREIVETDVDELWLREWAQSGLVALESYLSKHAAFAEFLRGRPDPGRPDPGCADLGCADLDWDDDGSARSV
jgi:hypothetical protein